MKKIIFLIFLIICFWGWALPASASELYEKQNLSINQLDINIEILKNGELENTEKFRFFAPPMVPFVWPIFSTNVSKIKIKTEESELSRNDFEISKSTDRTSLIIKNIPGNSQNLEINYKVKNKLKYFPEYDELHWIALFGNGAMVDKVNINVHLPEEVAYQTRQKTYAFGYETIKEKKVSNDRLSYQATEIDPAGNFTIVAQLPKGVIKPSFVSRFLSRLSTLDFLAGILVALLIPLTVWFIIILLNLRQKREITSSKILNKPPNDIPAAIIGVLLNKKLDVREFAATIIELAKRGFLTIVKEKQILYLIKRKPFEEAKPAEKAIIEEIFNPEDSLPKISMNVVDLKSSEKEKLSSAKVSSSSEHIYKIISALNYFKDNPHEVYLSYLKISIGLFFFSLIVFFACFSFVYSYPVLFFIPIGFILTAFILPQRASSLSLYTPRGKEVAKEWLSFKNYLCQKPIYPKENLEEFFHYLPYAIVMKVEKKWAAQFLDTAFKMPFWVEVGYESYDLSQFTKELLPLIYDLAYTLIVMRTPTAR